MAGAAGEPKPLVGAPAPRIAPVPGPVAMPPLICEAAACVLASSGSVGIGSGIALSGMNSTAGKRTVTSVPVPPSPAPNATWAPRRSDRRPTT